MKNMRRATSHVAGGEIAQLATTCNGNARPWKRRQERPNASARERCEFMRRRRKMDKDTIQIQMTTEEMKQFARDAIRNLFSELVSCRPLDQLITVDDRCRQRCPTATKKHQR